MGALIESFQTSTVEEPLIISALAAQGEKYQYDEREGAGF